MKRICSILTFLIVSLAVAAEDFEVNNILYRVTSKSNKTVSVCNRGYIEGYSGDIVIPDHVQYNGTTYKVTSIGKWAFSSCSGLTSVTIPNSIVSIEKFAFYGCIGLTSITIPNNVTSIDDDAFQACFGLTSVMLNCKKIGCYFSGIWSIKEVAFGDEVTEINNLAFMDCRGITSITLPKNLISIGWQAFKDCSGLNTIIIPKNIKFLYSRAFSGCNSVTSIIVENGNPNYDSRENCNAIIETSTNKLISGCQTTVIPNSVTSIGESAFYNCSGLISITIPNSVTSIGDCAFQNCSGLTSITIPNSVVDIGLWAFENTAWYNNQPDGVVYAGKVAYHYKGDMPANTSITIDEGVHGIAGGAFWMCKNLTSITFPKSLKMIGWTSFNNCSGLTTITIPNSVTNIGSSAFAYCSSLTNIELSNNLIGIESQTFYNCKNLDSVIIPKSVTFIGYSAFDGCDLSSIVSKIKKPFKINHNETLFSENTFNNATLYVPVGTIGDYKNTEGWKDFKHIEEMHK